MSADGLLPLPVVDALELDAGRRDLLRPGEAVADRNGHERRLPRWFYEVESFKKARETRLSEHFTLHELMVVDVREAAPLRRWPRYVPCAVTLLGAHLELVRQAAGTLVWVAANGGYRSPAHALTRPGSPHGWGTAANLYRVGDEYLDTQEKIERLAEKVARVAPGLWIRPWGQEEGLADDHLHVDLGYARLTPRGHDDDAC